MSIPAPLAVQLRFVRAAPQSITLDFVVAGGREAIERYELQYRLLAEAGDEPTSIDEDERHKWTSASSSLKSARCTKSALKPGAAYVRTRSIERRALCRRK